jgi:hypothetical protein
MDNAAGPVEQVALQGAGGGAPPPPGDGPVGQGAGLVGAPVGAIDYQQLAAAIVGIQAQQASPPKEDRVKPPQPPAWTGSSEPSDELPRGRIWFALVLAYCATLKWDMLVQFQFFLQGKALEWYYMLSRAYQSNNMQLTENALREEFMRSYDPDTRNEQRDARDQLHKGSCTMIKYPSVTQYMQEFLHLCRQAADLSVTDQIVWFVEGLSNSLKEMCIVDAEGRDWQSLEQLMDYAIGAEQKLLVSQRINKAHKTVLNSVLPQSNPVRRSRPVQRRLQSGPSGLSGKVTKPASPAGQSGPQGKFDSMEELPASLRSIYRRFGPEGNKSMTNKDNRPMTAQAFLWHINNKVCTKCHKSGHTYSRCPKK